MAQDIVTTLTVETGGSEKTIKALKEEIKTLKSTLESTTIGSKSFEKASKDLAAAQAELKSVMDSTKQTVKSADGSYDALVATMAQLKKEWRSTADEAKRNEIGQQIDVINTKLKEMDASIGNHQRNVGNYKGDIIEAFDEMGGGAKSYGDALAEVNKSTEVSRGALDGVGKMASGVAGGFAAMQGVMALCGKEGGNFEKVMVKMTAALSIAQGVGGLKGLIEGYGQLKTAFTAASMGCKGFIGSLSGVKKAIMATGIGVLVVAVGTLIAYWDDLVKMFGNSEDEIKRVKGVVEDLKTSLENFDNENNFIVRLAEAAGKSKEEILKLRLEQARLAQEAAQAAKDKADANLNELRKKEWYWNGKSDELIAAEEAYEEAREIEEARYRAVKDVLDDMTIYEEEQRTEKRNADKKAAEDRIKNAADAAEEEKNAAETIAERAKQASIDTKEEELAELRRIYKEELALLKKHHIDTTNLTEEFLNKETKLLRETEKVEGNEQQQLSALENFYNERIRIYTEAGISTVELTAQFEAEKNAIIENYDNQRKAALQQITNDGKTEKELEIQELTEEYNTYLELFKDHKEQLLLVEQWYKERLAEISDKYREEEEEKEWVFLQDMKEDTKALITNTTQAASAAMSGASQILSALAANQDQTNKEGFEKAKKMQIASATMNMLAGITAALSGLFTTKTGPWDLVLAGIQAATIATTGGIQIANIKKQQYDGSGGGLGNLNGAGATPNISMADMMPIQYTRELMTDTETTNLNKEQRVYVLESDITETQENVAVKESNSSF